MRNAFSVFKKNITETKNLSVMHSYLKNQITIPMSFEDLLRAQIVYSVSAFDKLIHDLVRIGIVQIFSGSRTVTPKYLSETISIDIFNELITATLPPKEIIFEQAIVQKLKKNSYQMPDKVADGLSYIWSEPNKWRKISEQMRINEAAAKTQLKLISTRRNSIVHEADIDPSTGLKYSIDENECLIINNFIENCATAIFHLVI
jgi:hypothetical protein